MRYIVKKVKPIINYSCHVYSPTGNECSGYCSDVICD